MLKFCKACAADTERCAHGKCKPCSKARGAAWREANPERLKANKQAYHAANRGKINARSAAWYEGNKDLAKANAAVRNADPERRAARKAANAAWEDANREKVNAAHAAWNAANPEKRQAITAAYYAAHKEDCTTRNQAWSAANRPAKRAHWQNRKAKARKAGGKLSPGLTAKLLELQRGKCACCGLSLGSKFHMDHIVPIALGGANVDANIQLLRSTCNLQKHAKHPVDFMQSRGYLL